VPIEDWESVFEPFVRIEGRGRSRGSGIGLFASRRLMTAMGGRIFIEPNGYASSRFVVGLPAG
jgi:signal transduction histidine kinase